MAPGVIRLSRGFDIKLVGEAERRYIEGPEPSLYALKPTDVHGIRPIPKLRVKEGQEVRAGEPLFYDRSLPEVQFSAPVSGEIAEIRRAAQRAVTAVVILSDFKIDFHEFGRLDPAAASGDSIRTLLLRSGAWPLMRQRPFNVVPDPHSAPRDIFVSCFDSAPLAPDYGLLLEGDEEAFQWGLQAIGRLTRGQVHLGVSPASSELFTRAEGVAVHMFSGPHPSGNVGIQIHHVAPINKGEVLWTVKPQDVALIGRLCRDGVFDARRTVAVTGPEVTTTGYVRARIGASVASWLEDRVSDDHVRYISGNVLTGTRIEKDGFLGLFDDQITVIAEGDRPEFLGWLVPSYPRPSMSRTFLGSMLPDRRYRVNSNNHGEERAFVMTGEYERVVPMDIYPQHLIKSIMYRDFAEMEGLGIYEVVEEDLALCEFACTSKQPVQQILREGLDAMRVEG